MASTSILAKSPANGREITLAEHTRSVLTATETMYGTPGQPTRLTQQWLGFFRLPRGQIDAFLFNLRLAAAFHDLGKANAGFQNEVRHRGPQSIRHEHLSALLLWLEPLQSWLRSHAALGVDPEIVAAAVVSHHLKVNPAKFAAQLTDSEAASVHVYAGCPDLTAVLAMAAEALMSDAPALGEFEGRWDFARTIQQQRERFTRDMHRFGRELDKSEERRRLLLAVKAALLAVDSAGSAVTRMDQDLTVWLRSAFEVPSLTEADIEQKVIAPRVREIERSGRWRGFHDFQLAAGELGPRALLLSGCGTGKTLAAWKWIAAQVRTHPASRVLFLYPTRATATEGFRDYVSWAGPTEASLLQGTAPFDLEGIFANPGDPRFGGDYAVSERLFSLGYWHKRVFSATVDSFLAFVTNRYAALGMLPVLVQSVIVVDEVHSFDRSMFRALERFLKFFDVPVLCMTASLPDDRMKALRDGCGLKVFPSSDHGFGDLQRQAHAPRYRVRLSDVEEEAFSEAVRALAERKRVLWVLNTVARCQSVARRLTKGKARSGPVLCYHSRFRLVDRRDRHEQVIARFKEHGPLLLVTTQVCEMSLDLDADLLITEIASVPALIQRMGRCCREPIPASARIGGVFAYRPADPKPYERREIQQGEAFVKNLLPWEAVAHADLAGYLETMEVADPFIQGGHSGFLDSGWYAMASEDEFREDDEFTVDCVLDSDVEPYRRARRARDAAADGFIVPVPRRHSVPTPGLGAYLRVARSQFYDPTFGFLDPETVHD